MVGMQTTEEYRDAEKTEFLGWKKSSWAFAGVVTLVLAVMLGAVVNLWLLLLLLPALACLGVSGNLDMCVTAFYHLCGPQRGPTCKEIFQHFDANKDGKISQIEAIKALKNPIYKDDAERIGFKPGAFAQEDEGRRMFNLTFQKIDTDGDKNISPAELRVQFDNFRPR